MKNTRENLYIALFAAVSIVLSYVESMIPIPYPVPGLKLGLANIAILFSMMFMGFRAGLIVAIIKSLLTAFILSRASAILYSFPATIVSTLVMGFILFVVNKNQRYFSEIGASVLGSVSFNITQLLVASIIISDRKIITIIPYMNLMSVVTGIFVGYLAIKLERILKK